MSRIKVEDLSKNAIMSREELTRSLGGVAAPNDVISIQRGRNLQFQNGTNIIIWTHPDPYDRTGKAAFLEEWPNH